MRDAKAEGRPRGENGARPRREGSSDRRKKNFGLDVIDKLDVTGIYGSGREPSTPPPPPNPSHR